MQITVYTKNHCQPCKATKRKLEALGLAYREINVDEKPEARDFLISGGWRESPVVLTADLPGWSGYRPDLLEDLAARAAGK